MKTANWIIIGLLAVLVYLALKKPAPAPAPKPPVPPPPTTLDNFLNSAGQNFLDLADEGQSIL